MIRIPNLPLGPIQAKSLRDWQQAIDLLPTYTERVSTAKAQFGARNVIGNNVFDHVKTILTNMCQGARRCGYCEDSMADEVEHIAPKDLYPEHTFNWDNYLYACGPCNSPKNNQWAVFRGHPRTVEDVSRPKLAAIVPPPVGEPVLINPRNEDPLHFLFLDLQNTWTFTPRLGISDEEKERAKYTIKVLRLNSRDALTKARKTAYGTFRARLREYVVDKQANADPAILLRRKSELAEVSHQTVWREMQRQFSLHAELDALFVAAPEALNW